MPVHTCHYSCLEKPTIKYSDCQPRKTTTYILHVVSITEHTHNRRKSIGEKKQRKEKKIKESKAKRRKRTKTKKERKEKNKKSKKRQDKKRKQGKEKRREKRKKKNKNKNVILADPWNWVRMALIGLTEGITSTINGTGDGVR